MIKRAIAPKIGMQITIRTQMAFAVEDIFLFFILNREINDNTIQDISRRILKIWNRNERAKFSIFLLLNSQSFKLELQL